eukprot:NODE_3440_length_928_cov_15.947668_g2866_i0.p1 GENE.NODE_3440_length_928_cov_15.947668_g2866_i0~~NODE_3440_length_928_cov_15.947668_g2866_i0.p1  ORF type:complete len:142 (+),score=5.60 NODE_3440_length_928_cov_15.947668_g2866_i0:68-493(+)
MKLSPFGRGSALRAHCALRARDLLRRSGKAGHKSQLADLRSAAPSLRLGLTGAFGPCGDPPPEGLPQSSPSPGFQTLFEGLISGPSGRYPRALQALGLAGLDRPAGGSQPLPGQGLEQAFQACGPGPSDPAPQGPLGPGTR